MVEHDVDAASHWWERALELQPRLVEVRASYGLADLMCIRQDDTRGLAELARAVGDDPRSAFCAVYRSFGRLVAGRFAEASAEVTRACELDPQAFLSLFIRVIVLAYSGDADGALVAAKAAFAAVGRHPLILMGLPREYLTRGDVRRAEAVYAELQARAESDEVRRLALAVAADSLGRVDEAIAYALESVERCDGILPMWTRSVLTSAAMRAHPRYPELLGAMGL